MTHWTDANARTLLRQMFDAAIVSANPARAVLAHLPQKPKGRCIVVGAGKASAAMAAALDTAWPDVNLSGVVVTRDGHAVPAGRIKILEASHPVPDSRSVAAAQQITDAVQGLSGDDLVIALISGGGSALMTMPAGRMSLADKQAVNRELLASGATIDDMNIVRKHLSRIKGGRLAMAARPARLLTLVISDVPGDDPAIIASGPTIADASTRAQARDIVTRTNMRLPASAIEVLAGSEDARETGTFSDVVHVIAAPLMALEAAAKLAQAAGVTPMILGDALEGEASELGIFMAGMAQSVKRHGLPVKAPAVLLSGGETTVSIGHGHAGRGGRNTEFLLSFALANKDAPAIWALAGDSDGIDGTEDAAGAIVTPDTLSRGNLAEMDIRNFLRDHDSYCYFDAINDLIRTGPTLTNVNDIRAILIT
ncbi:MAG: glycerate kinase [Hyphomicrobiales bacterium]|nr:glycerate kinase [Hyphomicrobiales bacterium]MDE2116108.1 glycerate kinase [Hyphomicrobiales bacterium]